MRQALLAFVPLVMFVLCGLFLGCGAPAPSDPPAGFTPISEPGFDSADNAVDRNDYPWAMTYFKPDDRDAGQLYVGTGNAIRMKSFLQGIFGLPADPWHPPEIRRYQPAEGLQSWERVLDWRDVENGPPWQTTGVRALRPYRVPSSGQTYLYAGTFGAQPTLWRSRTGDPGTWEAVWSNPTEGSIRSLVVHNEILYIGLTHESEGLQVPGEIHATDGQTVWPVMTDGFGTANNFAVYVLASFNGWLYAGTMNVIGGFEVWKLAGPDEQARPVRIIANGGTSRTQNVVGDMHVFQGRLYVASLILGNLNGFSPVFEAADMLRIDDQDRVEVVAGRNSVGGVPSGLGSPYNAYLWCLEEHRGKLYCGTWDLASLSVPNQYGARLYASEDGASWHEVFKDGLGNRYNFGVRDMVSTGDTLYLGLANIHNGLQIWAMAE